MILIISDTHLRPKHHAGVMLAGDCRYAIEDLGAWCKVNKPDACLHGGDIFNGPRANGEELDLWLQLCDAVGCPMFYIPGNHEKEAVDKQISVAESTSRGTRLQPGQVYTIDGYTVTGLDGALLNRGVRDSLRTVVESDILVMHAPLKPINGFSTEALELDELPARKLIVCGDTHKNWVAERPDGTLVVSPGCLFPQKKNELMEADRSTGFATFSEGKLELHPLKHRKVFRLPLLTEELLRSMGAQGEGLDPVVFAPADQVFKFSRQAKSFGVVLGREETVNPAAKPAAAGSSEGLDEAALMQMAGTAAGASKTDTDLAINLWTDADPASAVQALKPPEGVLL